MRKGNKEGKKKIRETFTLIRKPQKEHKQHNNSERKNHDESHRRQWNLSTET